MSSTKTQTLRTIEVPGAYCTLPVESPAECEYTGTFLEMLRDNLDPNVYPPVDDMGVMCTADDGPKCPHRQKGVLRIALELEPESEEVPATA